MKCAKCGKNEASYYYKETINGRSKEICLCSECAKEEGIDFSVPSFGFDPFEDFFRDFFRPLGFGRMPSLTGTPRMGSTYRLRGDGVRQSAGQTGERPHAAPASEAEAKIGGSCDEELRRKREMLSLTEQLHEAVSREDYEKAIELRDRLRAMEQ